MEPPPSHRHLLGMTDDEDEEEKDEDQTLLLEKENERGYERICRLGIGISGTVWLVRDRKRNQQIAMKVIDTSKAMFDKLAAETERNVLQSIKHPNIVDLRDSYYEGKYLVMLFQYAEGGDLLQYLRRNGKMPEEETRQVFLQVVTAIRTAHSMGVVHRDIKLENLLISGPDMKIIVADWGFAANWSHNTFLTQSCGSLHYCSPEIATGKPYRGPELDVWSMGVVLFALLTSELPFHGKTPSDVLLSVTDRTVDIPDGVSTLGLDMIAGCLTRDVDLRFTTDDILLHPWFTPHPLSMSTAQQRRALRRFHRPRNRRIRHRKQHQDELNSHPQQQSAHRPRCSSAVHSNRHSHARRRSLPSIHSVLKRRRSLSSRTATLREAGIQDTNDVHPSLVDDFNEDTHSVDSSDLLTETVTSVPALDENDDDLLLTVAQSKRTDSLSAADSDEDKHPTPTAKPHRLTAAIAQHKATQSLPFPATPNVLSADGLAASNSLSGRSADDHTADITRSTAHTSTTGDPTDLPTSTVAKSTSRPSNHSQPSYAKERLSRWAHPLRSSPKQMPGAFPSLTSPTPSPTVHSPLDGDYPPSRSAASTSSSTSSSTTPASTDASKKPYGGDVKKLRDANFTARFPSASRRLSDAMKLMPTLKKQPSIIAAKISPVRQSPRFLGEYVSAHSPRLNPLMASAEHAPLLRQDSPTHALQLHTNDHTSTSSSEIYTESDDSGDDDTLDMDEAANPAASALLQKIKAAAHQEHQVASEGEAPDLTPRALRMKRLRDIGSVLPGDSNSPPSDPTPVAFTPRGSAVVKCPGCGHQIYSVADSKFHDASNTYSRETVLQAGRQWHRRCLLNIMQSFRSSPDGELLKPTVHLVSSAPPRSVSDQRSALQSHSAPLSHSDSVDVTTPPASRPRRRKSKSVRSPALQRPQSGTALRSADQGAAHEPRATRTHQHLHQVLIPRIFDDDNEDTTEAAADGVNTDGVRYDPADVVPAVDDGSRSRLPLRSGHSHSQTHGQSHSQSRSQSHSHTHAHGRSDKHNEVNTAEAGGENVSDDDAASLDSTPSSHSIMPRDEELSDDFAFDLSDDPALPSSQENLGELLFGDSADDSNEGLGDLMEELEMMKLEAEINQLQVELTKESR